MDRQTDKHKLVRSKWPPPCYTPKSNSDGKSSPFKVKHFPTVWK